jgi:hypothetical protein
MLALAPPSPRDNPDALTAPNVNRRQPARPDGPVTNTH